MDLYIFTRISTLNQNPKSPEDQERQVREGLDYKGIDHKNAIVISEMGQSGTKDDRDGFQLIKERVNRGDSFILTVDDQSRFSRGSNVKNLVTDLVYNGGRFISTGEAIDTDVEGWEMTVQFKEIHHSESSKDTGRRVHRGQKGRVLQGLSAGDVCFGYESYYLDPDYALNYTGRGPKPEKGIRIKEDEAVTVRSIFEQYVVEHSSLNEIANDLSAAKTSKGSRSNSTVWTHQNIVAKLRNTKYMGKWPWGKTETVRNSKGKTKQNPVEQRDVVWHDRPDLAIVTDELFDAAQKKLDHNKVRYGHKGQGQRKRPSTHHTEEYPDYLLQGAVRCGVCGKKMWIGKNGKKEKMFFCSTHRDAPDRCDLQVRPSLNQLEQDVLDTLSSALTSSPVWLERARAVMMEAIEEYHSRIPDELDLRQKELKQVTDQLKRGATELLLLSEEESSTLRELISQLEKRKTELEAEVNELESAGRHQHRLPDETWFRGQVADLVDVLRDDPRRAAPILRSIVRDLKVEQVIPPGKKRGFPKVTFSINGMDVIRAAVGGKALPGLMDNAADTGDFTETFSIDYGEATQMDRWLQQWGEKIYTMRQQGVKWKDICEVTGLKLGPAFTVLERYTLWREEQDRCADDTAA
mgnify:CR=1 FL=1